MVSPNVVSGLVSRTAVKSFLGILLALYVLFQLIELGSRSEKRKESNKKFSRIRSEDSNTSVNRAFKILDNILPENTLKNSLLIWNLNGSKWAINASHYYKKSLEKTDISYSSSLESDKDREDITVWIKECQCTRKIRGRIPDFEADPTTNTCSDHSFHRGNHQNVVGFSFYGNPNSKLGIQRNYFEGIQTNLEVLSRYYTDEWVIRIYHDFDSTDSVMSKLCDLTCSNPNLDLCYVKTIPSHGDISKIFPMNWKFIPTLDPQVDVYVSRDLDSILSRREQAAVNEWLSSGKTFHFMRDHPLHSIEILGGGWGMKLTRDLDRRMMSSAFRQGSQDPIFWASKEAYTSDQGFLKRYIWPWAKWNALSHDSYTCQRFPRTNPFPTQRELVLNNFIGSVTSFNDTLREECPLKCRKRKDWIYC